MWLVRMTSDDLLISVKVDLSLSFAVLVCRRLMHCVSLEFLRIVGKQDLQLKSRAASPLTGKTAVTVPGLWRQLDFKAKI